MERTVQTLCSKLAGSEQEVDSLTKILSAHRQKHRSEIMYSKGNIVGAAQILLEIMSSVTDDMKSDTIIMDWLSGAFLITNKRILCNSFYQRLRINASLR